MKNITRSLQRALALVVLGAVTLGICPRSWAAADSWQNGDNGTWKFVVFGDHRGDNKAWQYYTNEAGLLVTNGYTDGGINKPALSSLAV